METTGLIQKCLHGQAIFLVVIMLTVINVTFAQAQNRPFVEPEFQAVQEGEPAKFLCRIGEALSYCRITIPGRPTAFILSPEWETEPGYKYHGDGLQAGQCGISIDRVSPNNHGEVKCFLGVRGQEFEGSMNLIVALPPHTPEIEILSGGRGGVFEIGKPFRARCVVRDARPPANITWFVDNEELFDGFGRQEIVETFDTRRNASLYTTAQEIQRYLTPEDNGRSLVCRANHIADRGLQPNQARLPLLVSYPPLPQPDIKVYGLTLARTSVINVTIYANPRPRVEWMVDSTVIPEGNQNGRYEATMPNEMGGGAYNVSLIIAGLTLEDTHKDYFLKATNEFGSQDYKVRISSSNTPISQGLDIGAIVGIIAAVAVLLIVVLLVVFARVTGRWCFAAKSSKSATSETPRDDSQSGANSVLLLQELNNVTVVHNNHKEGNADGNGDGKKNRRQQHNNKVYNPTTIPIKDGDDFQYIQIAKKPPKRDTEKNHHNSINNDNLHQKETRNDIREKLNNNIKKYYNDKYAHDNNHDRDDDNDDDNNTNAGDCGDDSLLLKGNQLGIPEMDNTKESRCSRWIPKDQRELLEKQAKLLTSNSNIADSGNSESSPKSNLNKKRPPPMETEIF